MGAGSTTGWLALGAAGVGAVVLATDAAGLDPGPCLLRSRTGVPCPACGLTTTARALGRFDLGAAAAHPAGALLLAVLAVVAVAQLAALAGAERRTRWLGATTLPVALGALLAAHWAGSLGVA